MIPFMMAASINIPLGRVFVTEKKYIALQAHLNVINNSYPI